MTTKSKSYDAIVIGAGHNGLVTAAYLAKAGLRVGVFERRAIEGGCAVTEELWPGFKISRLSYVNSLFRPEIVRDLELSKYGYEMLPRNPSSFTPYPDGRSLLLGPDPALCHEQISKFSKKDAEAYPRYEQALTELAEVLEPLMRAVPFNPSDLSWSDVSFYGRYLFKNGNLLRKKWPEIIRFFTGSAGDLLDDWFESDELKSTLATDAVIGANVGPKTPGTAYILFHHVMGECNGARGVWGYMRGGMGAVTQALAQACRAAGVEIHKGTPVERILVREGAVQGVVVQGGREYHAGVIASGIDPNLTFNRLIEAKELPEPFLRDVRRINYDSANLKINFALSGLPDFRAVPGASAGPHHRGTIHICPSTTYIEEAYADSLLGRPSRNPILECTLPSVVDSTLAPAGRHVMNAFVQYAPFTLRTGTTWDEEKEGFADRCVQLLDQYAPGFSSLVLHREVISPLDLEREFSLTGGNFFHGRPSMDQMFFMRPVPGYSNYRTPLKGLYICGSAAHPGGGVMGTPGLNAMREILRDRIWKESL